MQVLNTRVPVQSGRPAQKQVTIVGPSCASDLVRHLTAELTNLDCAGQPFRPQQQVCVPASR